MPAPPKPGESKTTFLSRCMEYMHTNEKGKPDAQKAAICYSMWGSAHPGGSESKPKPKK